MKITLDEIQSQLLSQKADAWIMLDYENHNPTFRALIGDKFLTRKIILAIPSVGKPYIIAHVIDSAFLKDPETASRFDLVLYKTWEEMLQAERDRFSSYSSVLMDISEHGLLPRVSLADYGSVQFIKDLGIEVRSSADILQSLSARLTEDQLASQKDACRKALQIKDEASAFIRKEVKERGHTDEFAVQQFIARRFKEEGMVFDEDPIVAIGKNAGDPHYGPTKERFSLIKEGDLVLIDMWAKNAAPGSVYADITWMGYVGHEVPDVYAERFAIIKKARDGVISFLKEQLPLRKVLAYEADDVARKIIQEAGFGDAFVHRVGHSITDDVSCHGAGANLDNFESHDTRELMDDTSFSDEPGIYTPEFGMRTETDLHIKNRELLVLGGLQEEIVPLL